MGKNLEEHLKVSRLFVHRVHVNHLGWGRASAASAEDPAASVAVWAMKSRRVIFSIGGLSL